MARDNNDDEDIKGEVAPIFGGGVDVAEAEHLVRAMEDTVDEGARAGDVSFMSFSGKRGVYEIGIDKREPGAQEPFLVAVTGFELGWMCWKGGTVASKRMANISRPKVQEPDPDEFGPFNEKKGEGWSRARAITVKSFENDEQCYFSTSSKSGVAVFSDLQREVLSRMKQGQDCWPVVTFGEEEFVAQEMTNWKPVIDVQTWLSTEQVQQLADPEFDPMSLLEPAEKAPKEKAEPAPRKRRRL